MKTRGDKMTNTTPEAVDWDEIPADTPAAGGRDE